MYTRPRHIHEPIPSNTHEPIPSFSTLSPHPSPSPIPTKPEDITWQSPPEPLFRSDLIAHPLPPFPPPPPLHILQPLPPPQSQITRDSFKPRISKPTRKPHLPAEKNAALKAAKIAKECRDLGPHTAQRFKCPFSNCNKFFQRRYNFKVHVRKHTNETPYTCDYPGCGKKFRWRSSISHHLKAHNKRNALRQHDISHSSHVPLPHALPLPSASVKVDDRQRRQMVTAPVPTSPISSGTLNGGSDRFQGFGLEHVALVGGGDVGMDELNFHHEHVTGMMFDNGDIM